MSAFHSLYSHGFVRVAACAPPVRPADPAANAAALLAFAERAHTADAALLLAPELGLTGYAIDDLLLQEALHGAVAEALLSLTDASRDLFPTLVVGAPLRVEGVLYNCALAIHRGEILGVVPKSYLPNYREYYEKRHFGSGFEARSEWIELAGQEVPFGTNLVFTAADQPDYSFAIEICEDYWAPSPPSTLAALAGAAVLLNLSASNVTIGKAREREILADSQSRRALAAYVYAASGHGESTTDLAWDGQLLAYELGEKLAESGRFQRQGELILADVDCGRIAAERLRVGAFRDQAAREPRLAGFRRLPFSLNAPVERAVSLQRAIPRFPFVPSDAARLDQDCFEAFNIQVAGLATRLEAAGVARAVIGVSGGLDSTHALLVTARAFDALGRDRKAILGVTLPGFATGAASKAAAHALMAGLQVEAREIDIRPAATQMLKDLSHPAAAGAAVYDIAYENVQAGLRADYLFRLANHERGLVVGTSDLSELALGWATYGVGDQMSHYGVNAGAPKTLIQHLIRWAMTQELFGAAVNRVLGEVLAAEISPELIPGEAAQSTEAVIGPYALQDFTLYHLTRYGMAPSKIAYLALHAWGDAARGQWPAHLAEADKRAYALPEIKQWLGLFLRRFFANQFKRSALPNGPKLVSGGALSPRGDWRMPSDASAAAWLTELERVPER